jgi:hypothetical protein
MEGTVKTDQRAAWASLMGLRGQMLERDLLLNEVQPISLRPQV